MAKIQPSNTGIEVKDMSGNEIVISLSNIESVMRSRSDDPKDREAVSIITTKKTVPGYLKEIEINESYEKLMARLETLGYRY